MPSWVTAFVLQAFNFPFQWWKYASSELAQVMHPLQIPFCSAGGPCSPPSELQESTLVPKPLWAMPPLWWTQIIRLKMDHVFFCGTSPHLTLCLVCVTLYGIKALCIITWHVQHSWVAARDVPLCSELLHHGGECHAGSRDVSPSPTAHMPK